jgi:hypothetical protein
MKEHRDARQTGRRKLEDERADRRSGGDRRAGGDASRPEIGGADLPARHADRGDGRARGGRPGGRGRAILPPGRSGAHTGDLSAAMLADAGATHVIVGHSERRADHGERNDDVRAQARAVLEAGLKVIVCVGETEAQRDASNTLEIISGQLAGSVPDLVTGENLSSPMNRSGPSARAAPPPPTRSARCMISSAPSWWRVSARAWASPSGCSMAGRSSRAMPMRSSRSPMSTARLSAAPR